jgi:hypothetical protein
MADIDDLLERVNQLEKALAILKTEFIAHDSYTQKSVDDAKVAMSARLDRMNEIREAMRDQSTKFITLDTYSANHKAIEIKIDALNKFMWGALAIVGFIAVAIPIMLHFATAR